MKKLPLLFSFLLLGTLSFAHSSQKTEDDFFFFVAMSLNDHLLYPEMIAEISDDYYERLRTNYYRFYYRKQPTFNYYYRNTRGFLSFSSTKSKTYFDQRLLALDVRYFSKGMGMDNNPIWFYKGKTRNRRDINIKIYDCSNNPNNNRCTKKIELIALGEKEDRYNIIDKHESYQGKVLGRDY